MKSIKILFIFILFFSAGQIVWAETIGGFTPVTGKCANIPGQSCDDNFGGQSIPGIKPRSDQSCDSSCIQYCVSRGAGAFGDCLPNCRAANCGESGNASQQQDQECYTAWDGSTVCPSQRQSPSVPQQPQTTSEGPYGREACPINYTYDECTQHVEQLNASHPSRQSRPVAPPPSTPAPGKPKTEPLPTSGQREFRSLQSGQKIYKNKDVLRFDNTLRQRANEIIKNKAIEAAKKSSTATKAEKITGKPTKTGKSEKQGTQIQPGEFGQKLINDLGTDIQEAIRRKELLKIQKGVSPAPAVQEKSKSGAVPTVPPTKKSTKTGAPTSAAQQAVESALQKSLEKPLESTPSLQQQFLPKPGEKSGLEIEPSQNIAPAQKIFAPEKEFIQEKEPKPRSFYQIIQGLLDLVPGIERSNLGR